ncbi:Histone Deacetylase 6 [Manis pentadactyla]|nr:Histone Deacetylase 6 [Manis pentadactyla]
MLLFLEEPRNPSLNCHHRTAGSMTWLVVQESLSVTTSGMNGVEIGQCSGMSRPEQGMEWGQASWEVLQRNADIPFEALAARSPLDRPLSIAASQFPVQGNVGHPRALLWVACLRDQEVHVRRGEEGEVQCVGRLSKVTQLVMARPGCFGATPEVITSEDITSGVTISEDITSGVTISEDIAEEAITSEVITSRVITLEVTTLEDITAEAIT